MAAWIGGRTSGSSLGTQTPSPVAVDGRVIAGSHALDPANGATLWTSTSTGIGNPPAVGSGVVVYWGPGGHNLAVYRESDGTAIWFGYDPNDPSAATAR